MSARTYDKGERRFKHVADGDEPVIAYERGDPKRWIGKCPRTVSSAERDALLQEAIAGSNGDRDLPVAKRLYVVHRGAIYEAQTSDRGRTYHAYPYRGRLPTRLIDRLEAMARAKGCHVEFSRWLKLHIEQHGRG